MEKKSLRTGFTTEGWTIHIKLPFEGYKSGRWIEEVRLYLTKHRCSVGRPSKQVSSIGASFVCVDLRVTCTHAFNIHACARPAPAIWACPPACQPSLAHPFIQSLGPIQPLLFVENSSVNRRPSFGCRPPPFPFGSYCLDGPPTCWRPILDLLTQKLARSAYRHCRSMIELPASQH